MQNEIMMLALVIGLIGSTNSSHRNPRPDTAVAEQTQDARNLDVEERKALLGRFFDDADLVVRETSDHEAGVVLALLRMNGCLIKPKAGLNFEILTDCSNKIYPIGLEVYLDRDLEKFPHLETIVKKNSYSAILSTDSDMVMRLFEIPISRKWRGLQFLVKGWQAKAEMSQLFKSGKNLSLEYVGQTDFQNKLLTRLGGKEYRDLLKGEIKRIKQIERYANPGLNVTIFVFPAEYNPAFERIFGPASSEAEKRARQLFFTLNAEFAHIEQQYAPKGPQEVIKRKEWCLMALSKYKQNAQ